MNGIDIRGGRAADIPQVMDLIRELAEYERALHEVDTTREQMLEDGFGENPAYGFFVAQSGGEVIGIALYYIRYSTWKGKMLYLEDLVIKEKYRRQGIGRLLFDKCLMLALEKNYAGMAWQVLDWNEPAIAFYRKYGSLFDSGWINGKLTREQIQNLQFSI